MMTKTYTLTVFNTCTSQYEDVAVTKEIYNEFRRGEWKIKRNNRKHRANETPFSLLIGGADGSFENFTEFVFTEDDPADHYMDKLLRSALQHAMEDLPEKDKALIHALFYENLTERAYAEQLGVCQSAVHKRKRRILVKLKKILTF